jgi:hypothetical protein
MGVSEMKDYKTISEVQYEKPVKGFSMFSGEPVTVIGEQVVEMDGKILEWYVYNINTYEAKNGKPFVAMKSNIHIQQH